MTMPRKKGLTSVHIGLVFDDEEVFGVIVEFDDEEETVTIEEDGTGDLVTGYQEDMFLE